MRLYDIEKDDGTVVAYPSATTILGVLPLPEGLLQWQRFAPNADSYMSERAMVGSTAHYYFECINARQLPDHIPVLEDTINWKYLTPKTSAAIGNIARKLEMLCEMNEFTPIFLEEKVWSHSLRVAGRVDFIGSLNGYTCIADLKTSKRFFDDPGEEFNKYSIQLSTYAQAYFEMTGEMVEKLYIVRCNENNVPEIKEIPFDLEGVKKVRRMFYEENGI